jgi:hypothetical protein
MLALWYSIDQKFHAAEENTLEFQILKGAPKELMPKLNLFSLNVDTVNISILSKFK